MTEIKKGDIFPSKVTRLYISNNQLRQIERTAFSSLTLNDLYLDHNRLQSISNIIFPSSLRSLSFSNNVLPSFSGLHFTNPQSNSLQRLDLSNNPIRTISSGAFSNLSYMHRLDLSRTSLMSIGHTTFPSSLSKLSELRLSDNDFTNIAGDAFSHLPQLYEIYLTNASLTSLDHITFPSYLGSLRVTDNAITSISALKFTNSSSHLIHLDLSNNPITNIGSKAFSNLTELEYLYLSNALLTHIPTNIVSMATLQYLVLSGNPITYISKDAFTNLTNLEVLHLSNTSLTSIDHVVFPSTLEYLILSNNAITSVSALNFTTPNSSRLERLDLSNNPIIDISNDAFSHLSDLNSLSLFNTSLTRLPMALLSTHAWADLDLIPGLVCSCTEAGLLTWYHDLVADYDGEEDLSISGHCVGGSSIDDFFNYLAPKCP